MSGGRRFPWWERNSNDSRTSPAAEFSYFVGLPAAAEILFHHLLLLLPSFFFLFFNPDP